METRKKLLSLLRVTPGVDVHRVYSFLEGLTVHGKPMRLFRWPSLDYDVHWPMWFRRPVLQVFNHAFMAAGIVRSGILERSVMLVREFDYRLFVACALPLWPWRRRIVLNMNFAPPIPGESPASQLLAFRTLVRLGYTFMLFEGDAVRREIEAVYPGIRLICPRFVVPDTDPHRTSPAPGEPFTVGFVGDFMRDKGGYATLIAAIRELLDLPGITVRIGIRDSRRRREFPDELADRLDFTDTWSVGDYERFIRECDAIVTLAERNAYYRRHSAIILDCISARTLVVCPRYPLFAEETGFPVAVGETYDGLGDLKRAVMAVRESAPALRANHATYFGARSGTDVARCIESGMPAVAPRLDEKVYEG
jgi:hypothetical protein